MSLLDRSIKRRDLLRVSAGAAAAAAVMGGAYMASSGKMSGAVVVALAVVALFLARYDFYAASII